MAPRVELQALLEEILGTDKVYFQPPAGFLLTYPCIIYKRDFAQTQFADNVPMHRHIRYQVTVIDRDPDSEIPAKIAALPMCLFDRFYTADNLNHDVFNLFF
jgi:hypothetical protein